MPTGKFNQLWSDVRRAVALVRQMERILIVPLDFPDHLEAQAKRLPHIVEVRRSNLVPSGQVYVVAAHPEYHAQPPV